MVSIMLLWMGNYMRKNKEKLKVAGYSVSHHSGDGIL